MAEKGTLMTATGLRTELRAEAWVSIQGGLAGQVQVLPVPAAQLYQE